MDAEASTNEKLNPARKRIKSEELFRGTTELVIEHRQEFYRLMITKAGKLILNK